MRTFAGLAVVLMLSWGSTWALNKLYSLGGHPVRDERLNPVLVQAYPPVPASAHLYLTVRCPGFPEEAILKIKDGAVSAEGRPRLKIAAAFASELNHSADFELFIKPIQGRGFLNVLQNPSARNGYSTEIKITDPYFGGGDYEFQIWSRALDESHE